MMEHDGGSPMFRYIVDTLEFDGLRKVVETNFDIKANLPRNVFRTRFRHYSFMEYDLALSRHFWSYISLLNTSSDLADEQEILAYMIEPSGGEELYSRSGFFGLMVGRAGQSGLSYEAAAARPFSNEQFDCMNIISSKIAIFPKSGGWLLWGSRDLEICVLGHGNLRASEIGSDWASAEQALAFCKIPKGNQTERENFESIFLANYGEGQGGTI
jgi:hypothetical protein